MRATSLSVIALSVAAATLIGFTDIQQAVAQDETTDAQAGDKKKARKLLSAGDRNLARGDKLLARGKKAEAQESFLDALREYKAAYDEVNDPRIFYPMALAQKRLGRHLASLRLFTKFLEEASKVSEALRTDTDGHINELKENLGAIFFRVDPAGAEVFVNDESIGRSPLSQPHFVTPGQYNYRIEKEGFQSASGTVDVEAGDSRGDEIILTRKIEPDDDVDDEIPVVIGPKKKRRPKAQPSALPLQIGLGLSGAFAIGATVTGLLANSRHNTFTDEAASPEARESARSSGKSLALTTDIMIIGGLAAATYSAYYYFAVYRDGNRSAAAEIRPAADSKRQNDQANRKTVVVGPLAGRDFAGMVVHGRF